MARTDATSRGIVIKDNQILLMHRRKNGQEYFVFPGGGVEEGETAEEAVRREIYEELGLRVTKIISGFDIIDINHQISHIFHLEIEAGQPQLMGEEKELSNSNDWYNPEWFDLSILSQPNVYPIPAREKLLKTLKLR